MGPNGFRVHPRPLTSLNFQKVPPARTTGWDTTYLVQGTLLGTERILARFRAPEFQIEGNPKA